MNPGTKKIILTSIISGILPTCVVFAASNRNDPKRQDSIADSNFISTLGQAKNIESLKQQADELEKKWSKENIDYYGSVMSSISKTFNDNKNYELGDKYAKLVLDKLYNLPKEQKSRIEGEFSLLWKINQHIFNPYKHIISLSKEQDWSEKRGEAAKYYFRVWERLEKDIDPNWKRTEPNKIISPPRPPVGYSGPFISGMSPDSIKDHNYRGEYEAYLQKFSEAARYSTEQGSLRRIKETDLESLQNNILKLYSGPEFDSKTLEVEALKQDLEKYIKDEDIRTIMLEGMKNRIIENAKPPSGRVILNSDRTTVLYDPKDPK
jgi:hypothetical protein